MVGTELAPVRVPRHIYFAASEFGSNPAEISRARHWTMDSVEAFLTRLVAEATVDMFALYEQTSEMWTRRRDDVELFASELFTNAGTHGAVDEDARFTALLGIKTRRPYIGSLLIAARDGNPSVATEGTLDPVAGTHGRGKHIMVYTADQMGVHIRKAKGTGQPIGKDVWGIFGGASYGGGRGTGAPRIKIYPQLYN